MSVKYFYTSLFFTVVLLLSSSYGDWKSDANARIEQIRKRNAEITVVNSEEQPVGGLNVQIEQIKHSFAFGTCIAYSPLNSNSSYRNFILNHFEWAVCENETKWNSNERTRDAENYSQADYIYNWCNSNGITMRGHCIFWEQVNDALPSWVQALSYATYPTPSDLLSEVDERINSAVNHFKNKFHNWDVDNEMLTDSFFTSRLGSAGIAHMFNAAKAIDPDCGMFMNEYSGNSFGGYNSGPYVTRANTLIGLGATIDGYGIQAHLAENATFQPQSYYDNVLQPLAALGKPIWATEFDASHTNLTTSADNIENFFRICFSHASVEGIIMWGFMQNAMWRSNAYLVDSSGVNLSPGGVRYESLLNEWTTNDANTTDSDGRVNFRGFHGTYKITLSAPGQSAEIYTVELEPGETPAQFVLETNITPPEPEFDPPEPNPMTWTSVPTATGLSSITMTATTATDDTPPVQYYFECTSDGDANSTWQADPTYVARNLSPSTQYTFRVKARDSAAARNETGWSNSESATTAPPSTDVEIIGSWGTGTTHAEENGTNRALIFIAHGELTGDMNLASVMYGGQAMTKIIDRNYYGNNGTAYGAAFILKEAGVAAATSGTFVPTWSTTPTEIGYASVFLSNVEQTTSVGATGTGGSTNNPVTTTALATSDEDMVILAATCGQKGSYTLNNGFIKGTGQQMASSTGVTGHKPATGASETPSATYSGSVNRQVIIGFAVQVAAAGYQNCSQVQDANLGLLSDLNGDCYVNYADLEIIANQWLVTGCSEFNNYCDWADIEADNDVDFVDFSMFGLQWMQCNDPQDPACTPNW